MSDYPQTPQGGTFLKPEHIKVPVLPPSYDHSDCRGVASILARVGDKWSVFVIMLLGGGPRRFNEIKRMVGGISQRMLTLTLRGLERDGLVTRTVFPTIPPRVDYELTDLGRGLWQPVEALGKWARDHQTAIEDARARFDLRNDPDDRGTDRAFSSEVDTGSRNENASKQKREPRF
jgi:DNA-binding HxlR family transcriptional regulator